MPPYLTMLEPIDFSIFTADDCRTLERHRLARLKEIIGPVTRTITLLDINNVFHLHCQNADLVDDLLQWDIGQAAQIILGCEAVQIWFADEIVWTSSETDELCFISEHHDIDFMRDNDMGSTVLEREVIGAEVKSQVAEAITPAIDQLVEQELTHFASNGEMASLIRDRVQQRVSNWVKSMQTSQATGASKPAEAPEQPTVQSPFKVVTSYGDTLHNAITTLISDPTERASILKSLEKKQRKGINFVEKMVLPHYPEAQHGKAKEGLTRQTAIDRVRQRLAKTK